MCHDDGHGSCGDVGSSGGSGRSDHDGGGSGDDGGSDGEGSNMVVRCREPDAGRERHVCVCARTLAHPCTQPHTCICVCAHPCTHPHMCIYVCVCAHTHARIPTFMDIPLCVRAWIYTHIFFLEYC